MAQAQVALMMCEKSIVQGVNDSAQYLTTSNRVHIDATSDKPMLVASQL